MRVCFFTEAQGRQKSPKQEFKISSGLKRGIKKKVDQNPSVIQIFPCFPCYQEQPKVIEPLDYEAVVSQRKAQIHNDPHRDLLLCPVDDVSVSTFIRSRCDWLPPAASLSSLCC